MFKDIERSNNKTKGFCLGDAREIHSMQHTSSQGINGNVDQEEKVPGNTVNAVTHIDGNEAVMEMIVKEEARTCVMFPAHTADFGLFL